MDKKKKKTEEENIEEVLNEEIDENFTNISQEKEELESKYKRALADYQNLEKRMHEQKRHWIMGANRDLLLRFLPVVDTLKLASEHSDDQALKVSLQQFEDVLKSENVIKIETVGKNFDPERMECITTESGEEGKVIKEVRAGYMLGDFLLRPSQVIVGESK